MYVYILAYSPSNLVAAVYHFCFALALSFLMCVCVGLSLLERS